MHIYRLAMAAQLLGVSDDTLRRWADGGRLATTTDAEGRRVVEGAVLAAFAVDHDGLEEAAANRVHRLELVARVEQRFAALHATARVDDVLDALQVIHADRPGQA